MSASLAKPELLFGGAAVASGCFSTSSETRSLLQLLKNLSIRRIDTAPIYPMVNPGQAEKLLGDSNTQDDELMVDTKIMVTSMTGKGTLTPDAIDKSISGSLTRLRCKINVLYCHMPDPETPVIDTAAAFDRQYRNKAFAYLGLSNFSLEQVAAYLAVCTENNYVKPSYYQGQYNALCRADEKSLLPFLRRNAIQYIAYSPLAGGFLTGKLTSGGADIIGTRFEEGNKAGEFFKRIYDKPLMHDGIRALQEGCKEYGISLASAAVRWLVWHSTLKNGDGAILGASRETQIEQNSKAVEEGPLPAKIVALFDQAWRRVDEKV